MDNVVGLLPPELQHLSKKLKTIPRGSIWHDFPHACWSASGGDPALGSIPTLAYIAGTLALKLLDDVQDQHIHPQQSNDGMALAFHVLQLLALFPSSDPGAIPRLQQSYISTILTMCAGQHLDLTSAEATPTESLLEHSWTVAHKKTGCWFAWGASLYPRWTGDEHAIQVLEQFGTHIGLMHQIANDVNGFLDATEKGDLKAKKITIPIAYLRTVIGQSSLAKEFLTAWEQVENSRGARQRIIEIARESGVETYLKVASHQVAQEAHKNIQERFPELGSLIEHPNLRIARLLT